MVFQREDPKLCSRTQKSARDTALAIFEDAAGCDRFRNLVPNITIFVFERMLATTTKEKSFIMKYMRDHADCENDETKGQTMTCIRKAFQTRSKYTYCDCLLRLLLCDDEETFSANLSTMMKELTSKVKADPRVTVKAELVSDGAPVSGLTVAPRHYIADSAMMPIPGTDGTPTQFNIVMAFLQHTIYTLLSPGSENLISDTEWSSIYEFDGDLFVKRMNKDLRLNFYGSVSLVANKGAIEIGKVMGATVYVHRPQRCSLHPFSIPAWGVRPHAAAKTKAKRKPKPIEETKTPVLATASIEADQSQQVGSGIPGLLEPAIDGARKLKEDRPKKRAKKTSNATLACYQSVLKIDTKPLKSHASLTTVLPEALELMISYLVPSSSDNEGGADVKLTRPNIEAMLSEKGAWEESVKASTAAKKAEKAAEEKTVVAVEIVPKHLMLC